MLSDIEISRQSPRLSIHALAERLAIPSHQLSPQGHAPQGGFGNANDLFGMLGGLLQK